MLSGLTDESKKEFEKYTQKGGGEVTKILNEATHIVIATGTTTDNISKTSRPVTEEWFWHSIRIEARVGESNYYPEDLERDESIDKTPNKSITSVER